MHFSSLGIQIYSVHTHDMRAHGVKQKPSVCAHTCADHEYVWVFLRKICACPFCPAQLVCTCEIKGCRPPPVLSSSPSSVARAFSLPPYLFISFSFLPLSLSLSLSLVYSFFLVSLDFCIRGLRDHVSYLTAFSFLTVTA